MDLELVEPLERLAGAAPRVRVSRRRFLQLGGAGLGGLALSPHLGTLRALAAPPVGDTQGILVVVMMDGGNDGLNTVCPTGSGRYYDLRGGLAIPARQALPVGTGVGLHPALTRLKARFDQGKVAIVRGVGYQPPDLSHFESMDIWMRGWGGTGDPMTGWLGRFADGLPGAHMESLYAVTIGGAVPMHLVGMHSHASGLPHHIGGAFGMERTDPSEVRMFDAFASYGDDPSGLHEWGDAYGDTATNLMDLTKRIGPAYGRPAPDSHLGRQLALSAHLINANLGIRVLDTHIGGFDTHASQGGTHAELLAELDEGIDAFFAALDPRWRGQVTLMTFSEFGRRPEANGDAGTDHGTAGTVFLVGDAVRGGLHGVQPSLTDLDRSGNLEVHVDFRSVYAAVLRRWLRADDRAILGKAYTPLDLFAKAPAAPPAAPPPPPPVPIPAGPLPPGWLPPVNKVGGYWLAGPNGRVSSFGSADRFTRFPSPSVPVVSGVATRTGNGLWLCGSDGGIFCFGDAKFHGSTGAVRLNRPIVGMAATPTGKGYWLVASDGGIFSFGDAKFFGSTGAVRLNRPIVGMAPIPTGRGYWLLASDGGIFSFGSARFFGSPVGSGAMICSMAVTPSGNGYWCAAIDGRVFPFGGAANWGRADAPTVVIAPAAA